MFVLDEEYNLLLATPEVLDRHDIHQHAFTRGDELIALSHSELLMIGQNGRLEPAKGFDQIRITHNSKIYSDDAVFIIASDNGHYIETDADGLTFFPRSMDIGMLLDFHRDSSGTLWAVCSKGKFYHFKNGRFSKLQVSNRIEDAEMTNFFEDRFGNLWIASVQHGLIKINEAYVQAFGKPEGLTGDNVNAVFVDSRNRIWAGIRDRGISVVNPDGNIRHLNMENKLLIENLVHTFAEADDGAIWTGSGISGLIRITDEAVERFPLSGLIGSNDIRALYLDRNGTLWAGTEAGLLKMEKGEISLFNRQHGMSSDFIISITEDHNGHLWLGTATGGVIHYNHRTFRNYTTDDGLSLNAVRSVYADESEPGTFWFGTEGRGLNRLKDGEIKYITTQDGLFDDLLHSVTSDAHGRLWMSTNRGIFYILKEEANAFLDGKTNRIHSMNFGLYEGMRHPEANGGAQNSFHRTSDNILLYPTQGGIATINTNTVFLTLNDRPVIIENVKSGPNRFFPKEEIHFEPGHNDIQISFTALDFNLPELIRFKYKLEGYDNDWIDAGNNRTAYYTNLPPRQYSFHVKASSPYGSWPATGASVTIRVKPFFYQQLWFYFLISLFFAGLVYGGYKIRLRQYTRREEQLQVDIKRRTEDLEREKEAAKIQNRIIEKQARQLIEMNQTKDKFISIIAHDLKGPFQSILGFTRLMDEKHDELSNEELRTFLKMVNTSSENVFKLLQNLLTWANIQNRSVKPHLISVDVESAVYNALNIVNPAANDKGITIITECGHNLAVRADTNMLDTILRNLLTNAIKFSFPKGRVVVRVRQTDASVCFEIADHGMGMSQESLAKIFTLDPQRMRKGTNDEPGTGLGLILCKEMTELMNGKIRVESVEGEGTTISVFLPQAGVAKPDRKIASRESADGE